MRSLDLRMFVYKMRLKISWLTVKGIERMYEKLGLEREGEKQETRQQKKSAKLDCWRLRR